MAGRTRRLGRTVQRLVALAVLAVAAAALISSNERSAQADLTCTITWTGDAGNGDWGTAGNWSSATVSTITVGSVPADAVPTSQDVVCIPAGSGLVTVSSTTFAQAGVLQSSSPVEVDGQLDLFDTVNPSHIDADLTVAGSFYGTSADLALQAVAVEATGFFSPGPATATSMTVLGTVAGTGDIVDSGPLTLSDAGELAQQGTVKVAGGATFSGTNTAPALFALNPGPVVSQPTTLQLSGTSTLQTGTPLAVGGEIQNNGTWVVGTGTAIVTEHQQSFLLTDRLFDVAVPSVSAAPTTTEFVGDVLVEPNGTFRRSGTGDVDVDVPVVNAGGRVDVASGSLTLAHDNSTTQVPTGSGTFSIEPGGVLHVVAGLSLDGAPFTGGGDLVGTVDDPAGDASLGNITALGSMRFRAVDATGAVTVTNTSFRADRLHSAGLSLTNGGLAFDSGPAGGALVDGDVTIDHGQIDKLNFDAGGLVPFVAAAGHEAVFSASGDQNEFNEVALTLNGTSTVKDLFILNNGSTLTNTGALTLADGSTIDTNTDQPPALDSSGSIVTPGTADVSFPITSSGTVSIGSGALHVPLLTSSGLVDTGTGTLGHVDRLQNTTALQMTGGVLGGTGTIVGNVDNAAGTVSPGHSPGTLSIVGAYQQAGTATFLEEVNGTAAGQFDRLVVQGTASLAGALDVVTGAGYVPRTGDSLAFLTSGGGVKGAFAAPFSGQQVDARHSYALQANADQVALAGVTALPTVSISDASVVEGDSGVNDLVFTLGLSDFGDVPVSVTVTTTDGTATTPDDYRAVATQVTIPAGSLTRTVAVPVVGDTVVEPDETLTAALSAPSGAILGVHPTGTGTIVNDDATPAPPPATVPGAPTAVTVVPAPGQATVHWLPPGTDGGSAITGFTVVGEPGGARVSTCADCTSVVVANLTNGTTFTFRVFATNAAGDGPPSEPSAPALVAGPPSPPRDLSASAGPQVSSAHLTWSAPADDGGSALRSYTVHVLAPAGDPLAGTPVVVPAAATAADLVGLRPAVEYRFDVVATNDIGTSGPSLTATFTLTPPATTAFVVPPAGTTNPQTPGDGPPGQAPPAPPGPPAPRPPVKPRAATPAPVAPPPPAAPVPPLAPATGDVTAPEQPPSPPEAPETPKTPKTPKLSVTGRVAQRGIDRGRQAPVEGTDHPCADVFLFLDGRPVAQASGATNGSFAGQKIAVPRKTAPGRHALTSSCSASGQPVVAATTLVVTARDLHRTSFANSVPAPNDLAAVLKTLVASAALAALLVLLIAFPAELFNATFEENYDEIRRWFRPLVRAADAARRVTGRFSSQIMVGLFLVGGSVLYALLDPGVRLDRLTFAFAAGLLVALAVMTFGFGAATLWYMRRRHGDQGRVMALPGSFLIAVVCVGLSRLAHFQPGYLYGLLVGYAFQQELSEEEEGRATAVASAWMLFLTVAAWLAWIPVRSAAGGQHPALALVVADAALAAVVVAGIEGLVFGLLPVRFVAGEKLAHWNRAIWAVLFSAGMFLFVYLLLRPGSGYAISAGGASLVPVVLGVSAFAGFSLAFWAYFRFRRPRIDRIEGERVGVSTTVPLVREGQ